MGCTHWREEISAQIDGEARQGDTALLDAHLAGCADCRDFSAAAERLHRGMRLRTADAVPDLTASILAAAAADRGGRITTSLVLRWLLVVVAALEVGLAAPALLGRWHTGGELSTWGVATAIGFLSVAHRPARAAALLPMLAGASLLTVFLTVRHAAEGSASISGEWSHGLLLIGVVLLTALWRTEVRHPEPGPVPAVTADGVLVRPRMRFRRAA
ncbi:MAG: zf-HC2 domain-containing protein [Sporichthyaceae bacterium]